MASNYTENYGLCQWEAGDSFVRTEFNQDNQKIDAAIQRLADTTEDQMAALGHDLYALVLQHHYEGMTTGWKKALFFDGFQDKALVASASESLFFLDRAVGLCENSQGDINMGYATQAQQQSTLRTTGTYTSQGYALLTGLTVKTRTDEMDSLSYPGTYRVYVNNEEVRSGSKNFDFDSDPIENAITFSAVPLRPGDQFYITIHVAYAPYLLYGPSGGTGDLGGKLHLTPTAGGEWDPHHPGPGPAGPNRPPGLGAL